MDKAIFILIVGLLLAVTSSYFAWKHADLFLARRDYYVNSSFDLFKKKLSLCLKISGGILFVALMIANVFANKDKQQKVLQQSIQEKVATDQN